MKKNLIDKYNRSINYLRVSVTSECNLKCFYCAAGSLPTEKLLDFKEISTIISAAAEIGISKIRLTGGEPLLRENLPKLIKQITNISGINEVSLTTNGHFLDRFAGELKSVGLHRLNISLDSLNPEVYEKITGGGLEKVLKGIFVAKKYFKNIRINTVVLKGINDNEADDFIQFGEKNNLTIRFLELMPNKFQSTFYVDCKRHFLSNENLISQLQKKYVLTRVPREKKSDSAEWFTINNNTQMIGFISPVSKPFCSACNRIRLTAAGKLIPCLHGEARVSLREAAARNDKEEIKKIFKIAARRKISAHKISDGETSCEMKIIGG